jgi:citrate synthase
VLLRAAEELTDPGGLRETARCLRTLAAQRLDTFPNVDFALALLACLCGMRPDAEEAVFAVARTAGWIAHALEEYQAPPVRHRPRGRYTGPRPGDG